MRSIFFVLAAATVVLLSCITSKQNDKIELTEKRSSSSVKTQADKIITEDLNEPSDNVWIRDTASLRAPESIEVFRVDVADPNKVDIYAHFLDSDNNYIPGLFDQNKYKICEIYDNGRRIADFEIDEMRKTAIGGYDVAFALDHSGSIGNERAEVIQRAFLETAALKHSNDKFAALKFDDKIRLVLPPTDDQTTIESTFPTDGLQDFGGGTALWDGCNAAIEVLENSDNQKIVILITDGQDNESTNSAKDVIQKAIESEVSVFTIGFGDDIDEPRLKFLAKRTGGKYYRINQTDEFRKAFIDIYKRVNGFYKISYEVYTRSRHEVILKLCSSDGSLALETSYVYYNGIVEDCPLDLSLIVRGVRPDGTEVYIPEFTIWERPRRDICPLLPYVFFDANSSRLDDRYNRRNTKEIIGDNNYDFISKTAGKLEIYRDLLNIIGKRWQEKKSATITLTGCNSDIGSEKNNLALSEARALAVKEYFVDVCGIDDNKIIIKKRNRPANPSGFKHPDAIVENRRVEISCSDRDLTAPFVRRDILYDFSPPIIRTYIDVTPREECDVMTLEMIKESETVWSQRTKAKMGVKTIDYHIDDSLRYDPKTGKVLADTTGDLITFKFCANLVDRPNDYCCRPEEQVKIIQNTIEKIRRYCLEGKQIETLNLVAFEMGESSFDRTVIKPYLEQFLKPLFEEYKEGPIEIDIYGHTCRVGDYESNLELSTKRALTTKRIIEQIIRETEVNAYTRKAIGLGETLMPRIIDNELPEGRMYSRTVIVDVFLPMPCEKK